MTYVDTILVPEASYTYVNTRQVYDLLAAAMTTHPAWDFVETVNVVNGANTYRRHVWKCKTPENGLTFDFFVVLEVNYVTATGLYPTTNISASAIRVWLGETYAAGVLGKFTTNITSVTLAADRSNPATFALATYAVPTTLLNLTNAFGVGNTVTSSRHIMLVAKDMFAVNKAATSAGNTGGDVYLLYVGAYESALSASDDPVPLVVNGSLASGNASGGATRAPLMTPATAYTEVFGLINGLSTSAPGAGISSTEQWCMPGPYPGTVMPLTAFGTIGAASTTWYKNFGAPIVARLMLGPYGNQANMSTKGVFRGWMKNVYGANLPAHSSGDTFLVDGKVHVGIGYTGGPLVNTEAA